MSEPKLGEVRIIKCDDLNWQTQQYNKIVAVKDKSVRYGWQDVGYYGKLRDAFNSALMATVEAKSSPTVADVQLAYNAAIQALKEYK